MSLVIPEVGSQLKWITGKRVLLGQELKPATIEIHEGKVKAIHDGYNLKQLIKNGENVWDAGNLVVMAGLVDSHVHVNEPGRTEWEGFWTATKAAAAGGITTIIDMPLNSIPSTTTVPNLEIKLDSAKGKCHVDVGFWGGVVPDNAKDIKPLVSKGVIGFKCFLIHSGIDDFPSVNEDQVDKALSELEGTGKLLAFHAEIDCCNSSNGAVPNYAEKYQYSTFLSSRPHEMELEALALVQRQVEKHPKARTHIVHLSSAKALPLIRTLRGKGYSLTVETCPHYLTLCAEEVGERETQFKCCPPIREKENQDQLWAAIKEGLIDMIVSDHSPATAELKGVGQMGFMDAWGGISSVQFGLPLIWSQGKLTIPELAKLMVKGPAKLAGLEGRKGEIKVGLDADFAVWDEKAEVEVKEEGIHHRNKVTPYKGRTYKGKVEGTVLRGKVIYKEGKFSGPCGAFLL